MLNQSIIETSSKDPIELEDSVEFKDSGELICKHLSNKIYHGLIDISNIVSIYRIDSIILISNIVSKYRYIVSISYRIKNYFIEIIKISIYRYLCALVRAK